jgi:hypothetical protein
LIRQQALPHQNTVAERVVHMVGEGVVDKALDWAAIERTGLRD